LGSGDGARWEGGIYATLYLAPPDYHRVHAPAAGHVREARYIPGGYRPVHPRAVASIPGLFASNERLITFLETDRGRVAVVMVGACMVGGIRVCYDLGWNAGPGPHLAVGRSYDPPRAFARGQELGLFEFGSTVILLAEPAVAATLTAAPGTRLRLGQALASRGDRFNAAPACAETPRPEAY
ncbi:MAG: phosphatidylserine decarboxylase, partial [Terriglobales bacterium]